MSTHDAAELERIASDIAARLGDQLPGAILQLLKSGVDLAGEPLQLDCSVRRIDHASPGVADQAYPLASVGLGETVSRISSPAGTPGILYGVASPVKSPNSALINRRSSNRVEEVSSGLATPTTSPRSQDLRSSKVRKANNSLRISTPNRADGRLAQRDVSLPRKKRMPDNPALQPSTLDKYIGGVWDSIFSGIKLDPTEVIAQWQAIESSGQPRLLADTEKELLVHHGSVTQGVFGRMSILARKVSQASRTCRSLEVIVQAHWVQCFDDRVAELVATLPRDQAKKQTIAEACLDFGWSEKELRNKMAIWKGYYDIKKSGGWAALVFAGAGLYRFCKYRVSFTEDTFATLQMLRHRFEVAADTLHPSKQIDGLCLQIMTKTPADPCSNQLIGWRQLLGIIGGPTERTYNDHPHDFVVCGSSGEAIPLPITYHQWDKEFSYVHLEESVIDREVWGDYDPRLVTVDPPSDTHKCQQCQELQSDDPRDNRCVCYPTLYGSVRPGSTPVQIFRTPNGKNNGLLACCSFAAGTAIAEFVGLITANLANMDVMVGQTDKAVYQIWQGRRGNFTRFVNHSCQPNSQYERFVWMGIQRIVLVSMGVEAGEEITVDYSESYWKVSLPYPEQCNEMLLILAQNLDKVCLCGHEKCRYRDRNRSILPAATAS
ncbi:hypothetical protein LTR62_001096 [Meristemomyces frigidus]|uniref:SET domain-containing protein n=1 Tax=Meristemomyces frigidus TaxID=1508187 RepID=A0AAN7T886_9PEZI|nr:hypothetical protein LTR62_001096 [Meristemomyces frigidus]